jgi:alpha-L-rhamnosidase
VRSALHPPVGLRCESLTDPVGVDALSPRLSWAIESPVRAERPRSYQVLVASDAGKIGRDDGDLWDSGRVDAAGLPALLYAGRPLESSARHFWKVRWWDRQGRQSPWSETASFITGFLRPGEWDAVWIGPRHLIGFRSKGTVLLGHPGPEDVQVNAAYLRKEFRTRGRIGLAVIFISGLGHYELRLNGDKVGTSVLDPGWTDYRRKALYAAYDVTGLVEDTNAVGVILGNGRHIASYGYEGLKLTCRIEVVYENGERETVSSDESWTTSSGPVRENGLYFGERIDGRVRIDGWDRPGFDDRAWEPAVAVAGYPLASQMMPPIRAVESLAPRSLDRLSSGAWIFDFGQNFSGWTRLRVDGPAGTEIRLRHAELLGDDGGLNVAPNENAEATDIYVLGGGGPEVFEPHFTYHGFRYVEMTGFPGKPGKKALEGRFVHSDVLRTGTLHVSNELIDRLHRNILWGQLSNLMSIPTDCPQRDERHGWLGDAHLSAEEAVFNFDMAAFYAKFLDDIRLAQRGDGSLPDVAPAYLPRLYPADPAWSSAYATIVELMWTHYGDRRVVEAHYESLGRYIDYLSRNAEGGLIRSLGKYGDWCPPGGIVPKKTPVELTSTWYYYHDVLIMTRLAAVLGRDGDVRRYEALAAGIRAAFNAAFLGETQYAAIRVSPVDTHPNQTSNVLPLHLDMVPADKKERIVASLLQSVVRQQDCHLDTGILGTRYLLDVLTEQGHLGTAWRVATQKSYPGWGYMLAEGATTLWERWEKLTGPAMNSQNHIMLGSIDGWLYRVLAGLAPLLPGWQAVRVRPHVLADLSFVEAAVDTACGRVSSSWRRSEASLTLDVTIPPCSTGEIHVPAPWPGTVIMESGRVVHQGGKSPERVEGLELKGQEGDWIVFEAASGAYAFTAKRAG